MSEISKLEQNLVIKNIDKETYLKCLETYDQKEVLEAELLFNVISDNDAKEQKAIMNETSIENMRQLWIEYKEKVMGPFKLPDIFPQFFEMH